jgi:hypothetical protein
MQINVLLAGAILKFVLRIITVVMKTVLERADDDDGPFFGLNNYFVN